MRVGIFRMDYVSVAPKLLKANGLLDRATNAFQYNPFSREEILFSRLCTKNHDATLVSIISVKSRVFVVISNS